VTVSNQKLSQHNNGVVKKEVGNFIREKKAEEAGRWLRLMVRFGKFARKPIIDPTLTFGICFSFVLSTFLSIGVFRFLFPCLCSRLFD
jgi:hypothetical protein